jgi:hypothetical protein
MSSQLSGSQLFLVITSTVELDFDLSQASFANTYLGTCHGAFRCPSRLLAQERLHPIAEVADTMYVPVHRLFVIHSLSPTSIQAPREHTKANILARERDLHAREDAVIQSESTIKDSEIESLRHSLRIARTTCTNLRPTPWNQLIMPLLEKPSQNEWKNRNHWQERTEHEKRSRLVWLDTGRSHCWWMLR